MASGGTADDRLSILEQGSGAGQIGFDGSGVYYGGTPIGTASIISGPGHAERLAQFQRHHGGRAGSAGEHHLSERGDVAQDRAALRPLRRRGRGRPGVESSPSRRWSTRAWSVHQDPGRRLRPSCPQPRRQARRLPIPGSPSSTPTSAPSSASPLPAPSPTAVASHKKKPVARKPVHHRHPTPRHHRARPHAHAKGPAKRIKDRRGADGRLSRHGGS